MNFLKKTTALLAVFSMLFAFASCGDKSPEVSTTAAPETATQAVTEQTEVSSVESTTEQTAEETTQETTQATTEAETTETATEKTTVTTTTTKPTTTQKPTTTKKATTTKKQTTTQKQVTVPSKVEDIVKLYNTAAATAASSKPGYKKSTDTVLSNLNMGALAKISAVRETIGDFLGEGSTSSTIKKGSFDGKSLVKSSLKASDVTSATCKLSSDGKYYEVKITVKNETNPLKGSSALGRFTKDYKDVNEIKEGLADVGASVGSLTVKTTSVTITAKISVSNNRFSSLTHNIKMAATLNDVKYSIAKVKTATADLETTVKYTDFKY